MQRYPVYYCVFSVQFYLQFPMRRIFAPNFWNLQFVSWLNVSESLSLFLYLFDNLLIASSVRTNISSTSLDIPAIFLILDIQFSRLLWKYIIVSLFITPNRHVTTYSCMWCLIFCRVAIQLGHLDTPAVLYEFLHWVQGCLLYTSRAKDKHKNLYLLSLTLNLNPTLNKVEFNKMAEV